MSEQLMLRRLGARAALLAGIVLSPFAFTQTLQAQTLLSNGKTTTASTQEGGFTAAMAVDGNTTTRWGSNFSDPQWITVDLGQIASINRVQLNWEVAYGKAYQIQLSTNGTNWTTVYSTATGDGGIDDITLNGSGRYVRVYGTARGTGYGFSLWEFQVYGTHSGGTGSSSMPSSVAPSSSSSNRSAVPVASSSTPATSSPVAPSSRSSSSTDSCISVPSVPTRMNASGVTTTGLVLSWAAPFTSTPPCNATSYRVYQNGILVASPTTTNVTLTGLTPNTTYTYTVVAINRVGASAASTPFPVSTESGNATINFGTNVTIFDPAMPQTQIQARINEIHERQRDNQFGTPRDVIMFKPGTYNVDIPVGFFTQVIGLGPMPDDVHIVGQVVSYPVLPNNNSTQNFWRGIENFSVSPPGGGMLWSVSQAAPMRRMHVRNNNLILHYYGGWASGGWLADSKVDYDVGTGSQQQWASRNSQWGSWTGSLWNMVFLGIANNLPGGTWPISANTFIDNTPVVREKPFLYLNGTHYEVFVPSLRTNSNGISWANGQSAGASLPISQFYVARAGVDNATTINAALNQGKNLILTPGIYRLAESIKVNRANTIVLGMGYATLTPTNGNSVLEVADVDGVTVSHLMVDAGATNSPVLIRIGEQGSNASHTSNPTVLHDVFVRVGGNGVGRAGVSLVVNSHDVIIDHTWLWRADHGDGVAWDLNTAANGLVVNGNNVSAYGLFVEHYQEYQVLWNGNNGKTYFYQSEIPYDPPTQDQWRSAAGINGWASYKVADSITQHDAPGMGIYAVFLRPNVFLSRAIETPTAPNVKFQHMVTVNLTNDGGIQRVINNSGDPTPPGIAVQTPRVTVYPQ
ncbi:MAG TPA: discoidin domain-containing protein [Cellvibrio sp.]|nr:discoidin domain-containing protein [Cellvibrio sp.]